MKNISRISILIVLLFAAILQMGCSSKKEDRGNDLSFNVGRIGGACYSDGTCDSGLACVADVCVKEEPPAPACTTDADCNAGEICTENICVKVEAPTQGCTTDTNCSVGEICTDGTCTTKPQEIFICKSDTECGQDQVCKDGSCIANTPSIGCKDNSECAKDETCIDGVCQKAIQLECAKDADCTDGKKCTENKCIDGSAPPTCTPNCVGKQCGPDGCDGSCGTCNQGLFCNAMGLCEKSICVPKCQGKQCGSDGCGGNCGTCSMNFSCDAAGKCQQTCVPNCTGKQCGADGCGGICGTCPAGAPCLENKCLAVNSTYGALSKAGPTSAYVSSPAIQQVKEKMQQKLVLDPVLYEAIKTELVAQGDMTDAEDITWEKCQKLDYLDYNGKNKKIKYLDGIENCFNIETLYLLANEIEDLKPLASLKKLKYLSLSDNLLDSQSILLLQKLSELIFLDISFNMIETIPNDFATNLKKLNGLYIGGNPITSLYFMKKLNNKLTAFSVSGYKLPADHFNYYALPKLDIPNLVGLYIYGIPIEDISFLKDSVNLTRFVCDSCNIKKIDALKPLQKLAFLSLMNNSISDISPLANKPDLYVVDLENNFITDISPLISNKGITGKDDYVHLTGNPLSNISKYYYIPKLKGRDVQVAWNKNWVDDSSLKLITKLVIKVKTANYSGADASGNLSITVGGKAHNFQLGNSAGIGKTATFDLPLDDTNQFYLGLTPKIEFQPDSTTYWFVESVKITGYTYSGGIIPIYYNPCFFDFIPFGELKTKTTQLCSVFKTKDESGAGTDDTVSMVIKRNKDVASEYMGTIGEVTGGGSSIDFKADVEFLDDYIKWPLDWAGGGSDIMPTNDFEAGDVQIYTRGVTNFPLKIESFNQSPAIKYYIEKQGSSSDGSWKIESFKVWAFDPSDQDFLNGNKCWTDKAIETNTTVYSGDSDVYNGTVTLPVKGAYYVMKYEDCSDIINSLNNVSPQTLEGVLK